MFEPDGILAVAELNLQLPLAAVYEETGVAQLRVEPLREILPDATPDASQSEE